MLFCGALAQNLFAQTNAVTATNSLATNSPARPRIRPENFPANTNLPSVFFVGDSTVRNASGRGDGGQWGWGDWIAPYFNTNKINVVNRALGGTTGRTFYRELWPRTLALIKPGDFVLMQFGTNKGPVNDPSRARGTLPGNSDDTQTITNLVTEQTEVVHSFGWYERQMIAEARSKGATAMVCTLIPRNTWRNGRVARSGADDVGGWARETAKSVDAPLLDINEIIARTYDGLGQEKVNELFVANAGPHTSLAGAQTNAMCVISALKGLKENPLAKYFSEKTDGILAADLSKPEPALTAPAKDKTTEEKL
jgi:lysophospholipase L1-like esterase